MRNSLLVVTLLVELTGCSGTAGDDWSDARSAHTLISHEVDTLRTRHGEPIPLSTIVGAQLRDGGFATSDAFEKRIDLFDSSGVLVDSLGRLGEGPGEFREIGLILSAPGDSLVVFDPVLNRLRIYDPQRHITVDHNLSEWLQQPGFQIRLVGRFADGRLVGIRQRMVAHRTSSLRESVDTPTVVAGKVGERPTELLRLRPLRSLTFGSGATRFQVTLGEVAPTLGAVCDGGLIIVDSSGLQRFDSAGRRVDAAEMTFARRPLSTKARADVLSRALADIIDPLTRESARAQLQVQLNEVRKSFSIPQIDAGGHVWFNVPEQRGLIARVDGRGRVEFTTSIPQRGFPLQSTRDQLAFLLVGSDTTDNVIAMYRLRHGQARDSDGKDWCSPAFRLQ